MCSLKMSLENKIDIFHIVYEKEDIKGGNFSNCRPVYKRLTNENHTITIFHSWLISHNFSGNALNDYQFLFTKL